MTLAATGRATPDFDVGTHEGSPYLVMELLEGETLRPKLDGAFIRGRRPAAILHAGP